MIIRKSLKIRFFCLGSTLILFATQFACGLVNGISDKPKLAITTVPPDVLGGPERMELIQGTVTGALQNHRIVIYAFSGGIWWVQPLANNPYTAIDRAGNWGSKIHLGTEYAALLVEESYKPPARLDKLPATKTPVLAMTISKGQPVPASPTVVLQFSGYEWEVRTTESNRGGGLNLFSPKNVWVDGEGKLHLRIAKENNQWTVAEVMSRKSFGYGTYRFVLQDTSKLDPKMAITLFTWHKKNLVVNDREIDIEISRWDNPKNKNSQYVIQPFYLPEKSTRFESPAGRITHSFRWEPNQVFFQSVKGDGTVPTAARPIFEHAFNSGVPPAEGEPVCMNFYLFRGRPPESGTGAEIVVEKFLFLP